MSYTTLNPVCTSCQSAIGHIYQIYNMSKNIQVDDYIEKHGYKPNDNSAISSINMGELLDKNDITNSCCRLQILGHCLIDQSTI